ncbi:hypothetical protein SMICM304S_05994 [Streptomyces microflavus]
MALHPAIATPSSPARNASVDRPGAPHPAGHFTVQSWFCAQTQGNRLRRASARQCTTGTPESELLPCAARPGLGAQRTGRHHPGAAWVAGNAALCRRAGDDEAASVARSIAAVCGSANCHTRRSAHESGKGGKPGPVAQEQQPEPILPEQLFAAHTKKQIHPKAARAVAAGLIYVMGEILNGAYALRVAADADEAGAKEIQPRQVDDAIRSDTELRRLLSAWLLRGHQLPGPGRSLCSSPWRTLRTVLLRRASIE